MVSVKEAEITIVTTEPKIIDQIVQGVIETAAYDHHTSINIYVSKLKEYKGKPKSEAKEECST